MSYSKHRLKAVVAFQKRILSNIEGDLQDLGIAPRLKYIQEFTDEFCTYEAATQMDEIVSFAADAQVVWIGDYHALTRSREFAGEFIRKLAAHKNNNVALAVEVVFGRRQRLLDRWLSGKLSEAE